MKRSRTTAIALLVLAAGTARPGVAQAPARLAFVDVTVIPMDRERTLAHQVVLVEDGRIVSVRPRGAVRIPAGTVRVDGRGRFLMPGLFDMHVHVEDTTDLTLFLVKGFTTLRSLEGRPEHLEWRRAIRAGERIAPDLFTSGPFTNLPAIRTPGDAERAVREQRAAGYDEIKVHGPMPESAYDALCRTAHEVGIPVVGHAQRQLPFGVMVRCGQIELSHAEEILYSYFKYDASDSVRRRIPEAADSIRRAGMSVTATLVTYKRIVAQVDNVDSLLARTATAWVPPEELVAWQRTNNRYVRNWSRDRLPMLRARYSFQVEMVRALHRAGVRVMVGSDAIGPGWVPGWAGQEELRILVHDVGMTPYEALRAATVVPAAFLGVAGEVGTIAPSRRADLLLLGANPLLDIANAERIAGVMVRGHWIDSAQIASRLGAIAASNERISRTAAAILAQGWQRAAAARCDTASPAHRDPIRTIVDYAVLNGVTDAIRTEGLSRAVADAEVARAACPDGMVFSESRINSVAADWLAGGRRSEAFDVLEWNARKFPQSFLAPYWLAEARLAAGDTAAAIAGYRRSVANDQAMMDAIDRLKELKAWP